MTDAATDREPIALARELIQRRSVTPDDAGCQALLADRLSALGFTIEHLPSGGVDNLWARHGTGAPLIVFAGHTDVVPTGPEDDWTLGPFDAEIRSGMLYGRGAADMKGSVAAMAVAAERFVRAHPDHAGSVALLLTSDEEGPAIDGTRHVMQILGERAESIDYCLVGEPSASERFGDTAKLGRRGSLSGYLTVRGIQGHVAYPQHGRNPIHDLAPALAELAATQWDAGNAHFPPTSFQISNIHAGTGADNVIPGQTDVAFNFRYSTESDADGLAERTRAVLDRHGVDYALEWRHSAAPFLTTPGPLTEALTAAVTTTMGAPPALATTGGTSDARFIAAAGVPVIELGPLNATIHRVDEHVATADLERMATVCEHLLTTLTA